MGEQVVGGLNSRVADSGIGVGHPGKFLEEVRWQLDDGAVLDEDAPVADELSVVVVVDVDVGVGVGGCAGNFSGDQVLKYPVDKGVERIAHAQVDGLAGRPLSRMTGFDTGGQVVAARRTFGGLGANGTQHGAGIDLAR